MKTKTIILIVVLIGVAYAGYWYWEKNMAPKGVASTKAIEGSEMKDALDEKAIFPAAKFTGENELSKALLK